jgi:outer membrane protein TolC
VSVASQYFNLIALQKSVVNRRVNYNNLLKLTEQTQALYSVGRINFLGVQQALQAQLFAESDLVSSQQSYEAAVDQYKLLLGMPISTPLDVVGEQLDVASPDLVHTSPEKLAIEYRLNLKTAEDQIDDARRKVDVAKNELLPQVDLTGSATLGDTNNNKQFDFGRGHEFTAGISVDLPVDRVAERNDYRRSLITLQQATRNYAGLRDQVIVEVRTAVRTIFSAQTNLTIQRRNTDLALRRLEYSYDLLKLGAAQSRDVVEAQQSLLSAEDGYEGALSNYQVAVLSYLRSTGTLRVDPDAGSLGIAMDRALNRPKFPQDPTASLPVELDSPELRP